MNWTLVSRLTDRPTGGAQARGPAPGRRGAPSDPVLRQASRSHLAPLPDRGPAQSAPASGHFRRAHLGGHQRRIALRTGRGGVAGGDRPEAVPTARRRRIASDQTMAVAASAGLDEFVAAADRHPVFELTITETTKVPGSVPAALIGVGLLIGVLHASLGAANMVTAGMWISGAVLGLLIAGIGNHQRIYRRI